MPAEQLLQTLHIPETGHGVDMPVSLQSPIYSLRIDSIVIPNLTVVQVIRMKEELSSQMGEEAVKARVSIGPMQ